jgi:hypothetical protein
MHVAVREYEWELSQVGLGSSSNSSSLREYTTPAAQVSPNQRLAINSLAHARSEPTDANGALRLVCGMPLHSLE